MGRRGRDRLSDAASRAGLARPISSTPDRGRNDAILLAAAHRAASGRRLGGAGRRRRTRPRAAPSARAAAGDGRAGQRLHDRRPGRLALRGASTASPRRGPTTSPIRSRSASRRRAMACRWATVLEACPAGLRGAISSPPSCASARSARPTARRSSPRLLPQFAGWPPSRRASSLDDLGGCAFRSDIAVHAARDPIFEAVPVMTAMPLTVLFASASAARSAPARRR